LILLINHIIKMIKRLKVLRHHQIIGIIKIEQQEHLKMIDQADLNLIKYSNLIIYIKSKIFK
jgi:hypothetical protein